MLRRLLLLMLLAALWGCGPAAEIEIPVTVSGPTGSLPAEPVVEATWLGETVVSTPVRSELVDGGAQLSVTLTGAPLRVLPLRIGDRSAPSGTLVPWYDSLEVVRLGEPLHFAVDPARPGNLRRVPHAGTLAHNVSRLRLGVALRIAWAIVALAAVVWVVGTGPGLPIRRSRRWRWWWDAVIWLGLAVAITWPAVVGGAELLVGRHFDMPGTIWSIDAVSRLVPDFRDTLTGAPDGASYLAFDSFTLVPLGLLLGWLGPARVHGLLAVLGVASSGWAATFVARALGARGAFALLAGLGFMGSGMVVTTLLEGHVYHLLDPWLPLFAWAWWRATRPSARLRHGVLAGLFFALTLLTTGYLAAAGMLLMLGIGITGLRQHRPSWRPPLAALVTVLPAVLWVLASVEGLDTGSFHDPEAVSSGATTLVGLAGGTPDDDLMGHSLTAAPMPTLFALAAMAPLVLRHKTGWRALALVGIAALTLSFGPVFGASVLDRLAPSPFAFLWQIPGSELLRFPARLGWAWTLCVGLVAARVASELAPGPRGRSLLALALCVDLVFFVGLPGRQARVAGGISSAYDLSSGPVFDLLPEGVDDGGDVDSWLSALACYQQTGHGRALAEDCVTVPVRDNPRFALGRPVVQDLLAGRPGAARQKLAAAGFTTIAWQPDLFSAPTRERLGASLARLDAEPVVRLDGAQHVQVFELTTAQATAQTTEPTAEQGFRGVPGAPEQPDALELILRVPRRISPPLQLEAVLVNAEGEQPRTLSGVPYLPGDWPGDAGWLTRWDDPGPGPYRLLLIEPTPSGAHILWRGSFRPAAPADRLELALGRGKDGVLIAAPAGLAASSHSGVLSAGTGLVAIVGWLAWLLAFIALGGWLRRRV